ncbi:hypothetical protein PHYBOEH_002785 [Phytophthora boehmeriae]|uniref:Uncharacterized protein n=1 Tax=Phytophthora boehmeriae TaxID=109152 RepID=A0A8T1V2N4_9STRA|nr:hypothetical protein PHYBOEH_002785 [Phytophthora boehmeriae]
MESVEDEHVQDNHSDPHTSHNSTYSSDSDSTSSREAQDKNFQEFMVEAARKDEETLRLARELNTTESKKRRQEKERLRREHHRRVEEQNNKIMEAHSRLQATHQAKRHPQGGKSRTNAQRDHDPSTNAAPVSNQAHPIDLVCDREEREDGYWYRIRFMDGSECDCVVAAINALFKATGHPAPITPERWSAFKELQSFAPKAGLSIRKVLVLLKWLEDSLPKPHVVTRYINSSNNLRCDGGKGITAFFRMNLPVGKYLVDCTITGRTRHCMAVEVVPGGLIQVFDQDAWIPVTDTSSFLMQVEGAYRFVFEDEVGVEPPKPHKHRRQNKAKNDTSAPSPKKPRQT